MIKVRKNEERLQQIKHSRKQKRKLRKINIDQSEIKVGWDELLYDLIFVIIISKITEVVINVPVESLSISFILSEVFLFISMLILWFYKVNMVNEFHIIQKKLNIEFKHLKYITYVEILIIILIFHQIEGTVSSEFFLGLILMAIIFSIITMFGVRNYLYFQYHENEAELIQAITTFRVTKFSDVNYLHILERTGVLIILFIGEILSNIFNHVNSIAMLLLTIYLILKLFNKFVCIIEKTGEKLNNKQIIDPKIFISFLPIFLMLLMLIITLEYASHYAINLDIITIIEFMVLYLYTTIRVKRLNNSNIGVLNMLRYLIYTFVLIIIAILEINWIIQLIIVFAVILLDYNYAKIKVKTKLRQKELLS